MLEVSININRKVWVVEIHAVRTKPKTKTVKKGTECTYNIVYNDQVVDKMTGAYGCGVDLAIKLLEKWKENADKYKMISICKTIEKETKNNGK